jgi:hypothetical protein
VSKYKPGATYVYERSNGTIYAREMTAPASQRFEIGHDYDSRTHDGRPLHEHLKDDELWGKIRRAARTNPALQAELDRVIMFYHLSRPYGTKNK